MQPYQQALDEALRLGYNIRICVRVTDRARRILLIQRAADDNYAGVWEVPGGGVESGEDIRIAAIRELREETGLHVVQEMLLYRTFFEFSNIETGKHTRKFVFSTSVDSDVHVSQEHTAYAWMTPEQVQSLRRQSSSPSDYEIWDDHFQVATIPAN